MDRCKRHGVYFGAAEESKCLQCDELQILKKMFAELDEKKVSDRTLDIIKGYISRAVLRQIFT